MCMCVGGSASRAEGGWVCGCVGECWSVGRFMVVSVCLSVCLSVFTLAFVFVWLWG